MDKTTKTPQTLKAEAKVGEILDQILYSQTSLTHLLIKAHRSGMPANSGPIAFGAIVESVKAAEKAYGIAIAQPENTIAIRPRVNL